MSVPLNYNVFVSYSRRDDEGRWVSLIVEELSDELTRTEGTQLRLFFDKRDIPVESDWRSELAWAVRQAEVLLAFSSPHYFDSQMCMWEFREYKDKSSPSAAGAPSSLVPVFVGPVDPEQLPSKKHRRWYKQVHRQECKLDITSHFVQVPVHALPREVAAQVRALANALHERRQQCLRSQAVPTNLDRGTAHFVGRVDELNDLQQALWSPGSIGVVTSVHGFGGLGKTELVRQHAHRHKDHYTGGIWQLNAEKAGELLPLIAQLAAELPELHLPEEARGNPEAVGRLVLNHLIARTAEHGSVLLVLDNVDTPRLLSDPQLGRLPAHSRLHVAATTRLGEADFAGSSRLAPIRIEGLSHSESVSLLRSWREFATPDDEAAAHELAELLDGFTLAVEQAAVHLATRPDLRVRTYLDQLKARGLTRIDALTGEDERARMEHQESSLSLVLESALASLEKTVPGALTVLGLAAAMPPRGHRLALAGKHRPGPLPRAGGAHRRRPGGRLAPDPAYPTQPGPHRRRQIPRHHRTHAPPHRRPPRPGAHPGR